MSDNENLKIMMLRETRKEHFLRDAGSLAMLMGSFWFNEHFIGGSYIVNALILVLFTAKLFAWFNDQKRMTVEEAQEELDRIKAQMAAERQYR